MRTVIGLILAILGILIVAVLLIVGLFCLHWVLGWLGIGLFLAIIGGAMLPDDF